MIDRREKSFFAPLLLCGAGVVLVGLASLFLSVMTCVWCNGTGSAFWNERHCYACKGRGRVPVADLQNWSLR